MKKAEIDSILLVNWYFTSCKLSKPLSPSTELVRKYLVKRVSNALVKKEQPIGILNLLSKSFTILLLMFLAK